MCGIYGYIGKKNAYETVREGLKQLQYRGYDSCGIAYFTNQFCIEKSLGTLDNLRQIDKSPKIAFGHTRWATNGEVCIANTHPHISQHSEFIIVHNGIITNAEILKHELINKGYQFHSNTDTEVIANLLESIPGEYEGRVRALFDYLQGSYSLIIGDREGRLYLVRQFSPLHILRASDGIYISSDINSLPDGDLYSLQDRDVLVVGMDSIKGVAQYTRYKNKINNLDLSGYKHYMVKEIHETPQAIYDTYLSLKAPNIIGIFEEYDTITLLACGTAYNSCLIGEWLLREYSTKKASAYLASSYHVGEIDKRHLHIIVTQSGETADCIKIARRIKELGGKILVITNEDKSSITEYADHKIFTRAKKELAVASTKTYCCQIFTFAYIVSLLFDQDYELDINRFSHLVADYIDKLDISKYASKLKNCKHLILIGKGIDYLTMIEASLKIREIDYVYTIPMFASELKHGTLSLIEEGSLVLSLSSSKENDLTTTKNEIRSRNGEVLEFDELVKGIDIDDKYLPIFSIIPFQLLSYEIALLNGHNPDMPRNLAKSVTVE